MGFKDRLSLGQGRVEQNKRIFGINYPKRTMLKNTFFCILLLVVAASGCMDGKLRRREIAVPREASGFQHPAKALFDVGREGHTCVTWEQLLNIAAPEDTWPISRDELHALFDKIDSDNDACVTWKEVDSYDGWTA